jgi:hypothetical protein
LRLERLDLSGTTSRCTATGGPLALWFGHGVSPWAARG